MKRSRDDDNNEEYPIKKAKIVNDKKRKLSICNNSSSDYENDELHYEIRRQFHQIENLINNLNKKDQTINILVQEKNNLQNYVSCILRENEYLKNELMNPLSHLNSDVVF
jgi:hypothetical protein